MLRNPYRIPWTHVLFDNHRSIDAPHDCQWISHEFWVPEKEFQEKKEFKFKDKVNGQALRRFSPTQESRRRIKLVRPPQIENLSDQKHIDTYIKYINVFFAEEKFQFEKMIES